MDFVSKCVPEYVCTQSVPDYVRTQTPPVMRMRGRLLITSGAFFPANTSR